MYADRIRPDIRHSLDEYARIGRPTGDFLRAVLENNLMESFGQADDENRNTLFEICSYVYNDMPAVCHGSPEKVDAWLAKKREERGG
jgi:hypothetical protein